MPSAALRVSQIEFDLILPRGVIETFSFHVLNNEEEPTEVTLTLADWDRDLRGENRFYPPGQIARSAAGWISVAPTKFALKKDEQREVRYTIRVPPEIEGTYWAAIMVEGTPQQTAGQPGTTVVIRRRFAVKVYETPPGTGKKAGRITGLELRGLNPPNVYVEFENKGNAHFPEVKGLVEIRDEKGTTLEKIAVAGFPILPGAKRGLVVNSSRQKGDLVPPGRYVILAVLDYGGDSQAGGQLIARLKELKLVPVGDSKAPPQDLDKDGLYEDVNGDGRLTIDDATLLGFHLDSPAIQENARAFDFDNNGPVNFEDVLALKALVEQKSKSPS
jgi:hypothetical protein